MQWETSHGCDVTALLTDEIAPSHSSMKFRHGTQISLVIEICR